jgi:WD40 repeat protein
VAFSPRGNILATVFDGRVRLWDVATERPVAILLLTSSAVGVAFSPDGKILATVNSDGALRLWDIAAGHPLGHPLPGRTRPWTGVRACSSQALSPDGKILAIQKPDGLVEVGIEPRAARTGSFPAGCGTLDRPFKVIFKLRE